MLTADQLGQVLGLLGFIAVAVDLVHTEVAVRTVGQAYRRAGTGDLLHRHHMRQIAHVGAAILFGYRDAQHAQVTKLAPQVHRELVIAVNLGGTRRDFSLRKLAHGITQSVDILTQLEIQAWQSGHGLVSYLYGAPDAAATGEGGGTASLRLRSRQLYIIFLTAALRAKHGLPAYAHQFLPSWPANLPTGSAGAGGALSTPR